MNPNPDQLRRTPTSPGTPTNVPNAPPLPPSQARPLQRAKEAANRFFGYTSRPQTSYGEVDRERFTQASLIGTRHASLGIGQNATASHKTGLEINTIAINEQGTHALLGGREIFKTIKVEDGTCTEELNLRTAIRSNPNQASGKPRQVYSIDIADVAWGRGDCGDLVAAATSSGKIILYDLGHAGLQAAQLHEHYRQVHKITFNPHRGNLLLSGSQDGTVRLWDIRDARNQASTLQSKRKYSGQSDGVRDVKWSPTDGVDFAFGTDSGWIQRWDIRNLNSAKVKIPAHSLTCNAVDWHPDGKHVLSVSSDKSVRVWDFSSAKKQKAAWEIKAPYPVLNARWRPPYESSMVNDNGARLCTQIVTSYDQEHPGLHLWDLRRPALPFREMSPYLSAPTDLIWHSQDLLWTVGREGIFVQADIQHSPKVIEKRNLQAFAVSPLGDVNIITQKRKGGHRHPKHPILSSPNEPQNKQSKSLGGSPETGIHGRSWTDDTLDHSFLSAIPTPGHTRANSNSSRGPQNTNITLKLDEILMNRKSFRPQQSAARGLLPDHLDPKITKFLAKNYLIALADPTDNTGFLKSVKEAFEKNASIADSAGQYRLAQSWRIVEMVASRLTNDRIRAKEAHEKENKPTKKIHGPTLGDIAVRLMRQHKSPTQSPASIKPISAIAQQLAAPESTSNVPTPLARPLQSSQQLGFGGAANFPDLEADEHLALPPSVTQHLPARTTKASTDGDRLTSMNLNDWEKRQAGTKRPDPVKNWSAQPRTPLSLDPVGPRAVNMPPKLQKWHSDDSFTFLAYENSESVSSLTSVDDSTASGPTGLVAERPSRLPRTHSERPPNYAESRVPVEELKRPTLPGVPTGVMNGQTGPAERQTSMATIVTLPKQSAPEPKKRYQPFLDVAEDEEIDTEEEKPWTLVDMLNELIKYHSGRYGDAQTAAHLLTLLLPLLPPTHPLPSSEIRLTTVSYAETYSHLGHLPEEVSAMIDKHLVPVIKAGLQPLQVESILSGYHEQLVAHQLFNEAAHLRKLSYPTYPAVYEDYTKDNDMHLMCGDCGSVLQFGSRQLRCTRCTHRKQPICPFCCCDVSPLSNSKLLSSCMLCGHSGHADCLYEWFTINKGDGCPTQGCLCDCTEGPLREEKRRILEKQRQARTTSRVKRDDWKARESKAVEGARAALAGAPHLSGPSA